MRRICAAGLLAGLLLSVGWLGAAERPRPADKDKNAPKAPTRQDVARSLEQEQKVYLQRLQFCTRLREIAAETGDDELRRKADVLEEQATEVYTKRTSTLPNILQDVKAAEAALERPRNAPPSGTASAGERPAPRRAPNGRPIVTRE